MSGQAKESRLSSKFFNTFLWATGISILLIIPLVILVLDSTSQIFLVSLLCIVGAAINGIFAGVIAMMIPSNAKIIYIPVSLVIMWIVSSILSSALGTNFLLPKKQNNSTHIETYESQHDAYDKNKADEFDAFLDDYEGQLLD